MVEESGATAWGEHKLRRDNEKATRKHIASPQMCLATALAQAACRLVED
jgi:hypothetical protein